MPNSVFGTFDTDSPNPPTFNSLNYLKTLPASIGQKFGDGQWHVVKMFSAQPLEPKLLNELYGEGNVGKTFEKVFLAYPKLDPIEDEKILAPIRPDESLFYVNGFERIISTMETSVRGFASSWVRRGAN
jgi:prenylcysteine oxidase/farnesylcysteine lyase